jgi:hypothetical protein
MNQVNARHEIIREWRWLPKEQRQTDEQAEAFAMQIKDKYKFSSDSADPYHRRSKTGNVMAQPAARLFLAGRLQALRSTNYGAFDPTETLTAPNGNRS